MQDLEELSAMIETLQDLLNHLHPVIPVSAKVIEETLRSGSADRIRQVFNHLSKDA